MTCPRFEPDWIGRLYGELAPRAAREMDDHLSGCADCRRTLAALEGSRAALVAAIPAVPPAPRVIVLGRRRRRGSSWSFAAGAAAALALVALGVFTAPWLFPERALAARAAEPSPSEPATTDLATANELGQRIHALEQRLVRMEQPPATGEATADLVTAERFDQALRALERRIDRERGRDRDFLLQAVTAAELRTGAWYDQTRDALQYLALKQDPRYSEQ